MTDHILIDGWNVCWNIPAIASCIPDRLSSARQQLNLLIKNYLHDKKIIYRIIYDGQPDVHIPGSSAGSPNILFSRNPEKADHLIIAIIKKQKRPRQWTVITSDRELARRVQALDAYTISSQEFVKRLLKNRSNITDRSVKDSPTLSPEEMNYWLHKFKNK